MGISRGSSGEEGDGFSVPPGEARAVFLEALEVILMGLTSGRLEFEGKYFHYNVRTRLKPYQRPYPPLWYPTSNVESVPWMAAQGFSTILGVNQHPTFDRLAEWLRLYRTEYEAHRADPGRANGHVSHPCYGFQIHTHLAETDEQARKQAREAYAVFFENFTRRFRERGQTDKYANLADFDRLLEEGKLLVGSPATVRDRLERYLRLSGANYFLGSFAFGNLTREQILTSVDLFASEVIPALSSLSPDVL